MIERRKAERRSDFSECPRYDKHELTEEQIEEIASRAAQKAVDSMRADFYQSVGQRVVSSIYWVVGVVAVGLFVFAVKMGWVKP